MCYGALSYLGNFQDLNCLQEIVNYCSVSVKNALMHIIDWRVINNKSFYSLAYDCNWQGNYLKKCDIFFFFKKQEPSWMMGRNAEYGLVR